MPILNVKKFLKLIKVYDCEYTKIRIGNGNDGGYVALQEICEKTPLVYTFGVGDNIEFEKDFKVRFPQAKMHLYDPYLDKLPEQYRGLSFHKYGIGSKYKPITGVVRDSLLKIDVEGEEWAAFHNFEPEEIQKFSQIIAEFHIIDVPPRLDLSPYFCQMYNDYYERINEDLFTSYIQVFEFLFNWFKIVHIHANNSLPVNYVDGYGFPPLLEMTFLRSDLGTFKPSKVNFPIEGLDVQNKTNRADIHDYYPFL